MHTAVYRLREHGVKLPKPKDAVVGELRLRPHQVGTNDPRALLAELLLDSGGLALPPLHGAVLHIGPHLLKKLYLDEHHPSKNVLLSIRLGWQFPSLGLISQILEFKDGTF